MMAVSHIERGGMMSDLDWEDLQRRFYDYFYTARRLGFYVPELQRQEKSLMECCPYPKRKDDVKSTTATYRSGGL